MPSQHKTSPVSFRPPERDRAWLYAHAETTGRPVNAILAEALREYRQRHDKEFLVALTRLRTEP